MAAAKAEQRRQGARVGELEGQLAQIRALATDEISRVELLEAELSALKQRGDAGLLVSDLDASVLSWEEFKGKVLSTGQQGDGPVHWRLEAAREHLEAARETESQETEKRIQMCTPDTPAGRDHLEFDRWDADADGVIDRSEFAEMRANIRTETSSEQREEEGRVAQLEAEVELLRRQLAEARGEDEQPFLTPQMLLPARADPVPTTTGSVRSVAPRLCMSQTDEACPATSAYDEQSRRYELEWELAAAKEEAMEQDELTRSLRSKIQVGEMAEEMSERETRNLRERIGKLEWENAALHERALEAEQQLEQYEDDSDSDTCPEPLQVPASLVGTYGSLFAF
eukprot:TRINITY_DN28236_c0_g1_i2.p1 TRINITY_DN28236_c0_g1~~TRINITY_DN28236_c0_g1_i2.p1  ORF type:complete len:341 (-),score=113.78 TRINITY_DN28236_c0_g1_i2:189-1211(-)